MSFCWFTSFIGYPNFGLEDGKPYEVAQAFMTLARASIGNRTYSKSKLLFPDLDAAQVETKKAAFQEFGLLYVVPRSNVLSLTPLGRQVYDLASAGVRSQKTRRAVLLCLGQALTRYQFNNPLPVGGNKSLVRARSSDVLPYFVCYYLLLKLGTITTSELKGSIFGFQSMAELRTLEKAIVERRMTAVPFPELAGLPVNKFTANNLKIYFVSHLGMDGEILVTTRVNYYGIEEQAFELTQFGHEILERIFDQEWATWNDATSVIPTATDFPDIASYFEKGVGKACELVETVGDIEQAEIDFAKSLDGVLDIYDIESLKELPQRKFEEGKRRFVQHAKLEKVRNSALVKEAKRLFKVRTGKLYCETCGFDFEIKYGERGNDYIEAHHKMPISQLEESVQLTTDDLAMVCSNCHRMLHRPPWITVEELIELIDLNDSDGI